MPYQFAFRPEMHSQLSIQAQLAVSFSANRNPVLAWTPVFNVSTVPGTLHLSLCAEGQLCLQAECVVAECKLSFAWRPLSAYRWVVTMQSSPCTQLPAHSACIHSCPVAQSQHLQTFKASMAS